MYKKHRPYPKATTLRRNNAYAAEPIEKKVFRILNNKEPITDAAPRIFTERKDGVKAEHNIRTDRFEVAIDAMDYVSKSRIAKREERINNLKVVKKENDGNGEGGNVGEAKSI